MEIYGDVEPERPMEPQAAPGTAAGDEESALMQIYAADEAAGPQAEAPTDADTERDAQSEFSANASTRSASEPLSARSDDNEETTLANIFRSLVK